MSPAWLVQEDELRQALLAGSQDGQLAEAGQASSLAAAQSSRPAEPDRRAQPAQHFAAQAQPDSPQVSSAEAPQPASRDSALLRVASLPALQATSSSSLLEPADPSAGDDQRPSSETKGAADGLELDLKQLSPKRTPRVQTQVC